MFDNLKTVIEHRSLILSNFFFCIELHKGIVVRLLLEVNFQKSKVIIEFFYVWVGRERWQLFLKFAVAFASFVQFVSKLFISNSPSVRIIVSFLDCMEFVALIGPRKSRRKPLYKFQNSILQNVRSPFYY